MKVQLAQTAVGSIYGVICSPKQARDEVLSLSRKFEEGALDDVGEKLVAMIEIAYGESIGDIAKYAYRNWPCEKSA